MSEKTLKTRIVHKHDTEANWKLATNFSPLNGELIIYDEDANYSYKRMKLGDGTTNVNSLPFIDDAIKELIPEDTTIDYSELEFDTSEIVGSAANINLATVSFYNYDDSLLYGQPTAIGDDCSDIVADGLIDAPTKPATNEYSYTHSGWSLSKDGSADANALSNITEDRVVYATYNTGARYYTVNFYDGTTLVDTVQVAYGATATTDYMKDDYYISGYEPSNVNITQDTDIMIQFEYDDGYIKDDWDVIAQNVSNGTYQQKYAVGDMKQLQLTNISGDKYTIDFEIIALDHDTLETGGKAGLTFLAKQTIRTGGTIPTSGSTYLWGNYDGGWRHVIQTNIFNELPEKLQTAIKRVVKSSTNTYANKYFCNDTLWVPSAEEVTCFNTQQNNDYDEPYEYLATASNRIKICAETGTTLQYPVRTAGGSIGATSYGGMAVKTDGSANYTYSHTQSRGYFDSLIGFCI